MTEMSETCLVIFNCVFTISKFLYKLHKLERTKEILLCFVSHNLINTISGKETLKNSLLG